MRLEAIGRYQLGLTVAEFWELTPAQFTAFLEQVESERRLDLTLNARIMWSIFAANGSKKKGGGKWSLKDFLPQRFQRERQEAPRSTEDLLAMARHLNAMMGGKDLTRKKEQGGARPVNR